MALLRSCYSTRVNFFRDFDHATTIRWYWTTKPFLPVPTTFDSRNWCAEAGEWDTVLGEVQGETRVYDKGGDPPNIPGDAYCGTTDQWANGCLIRDQLGPGDLEPDGTPKCCFRPRPGCFPHDPRPPGGYCCGFCTGFC